MNEQAGKTKETRSQVPNLEQASTPPSVPVVRKIAFADILEILDLGFRDFLKAPLYGAFFGGFYAAAGWFLIAMFYLLKLNYYVYPMITGFAMVAPFVAAGLYDISRRIELGMPLNWGGVLGSLKRARGGDLVWMVLVTTFSYIIWMDIAAALYVIFFGLRPLGFGELIAAILTTPMGALFFIVGNTAGAILSTIVFSISVVSFPLLYDREIDFVTAMITSVEVVKANKVPMFAWGAIIAMMMFISFATVFVALLITLPILGHASWHLYRKAIEPEEA